MKFNHLQNCSRLYVAGTVAHSDGGDFIGRGCMVAQPIDVTFLAGREAHERHIAANTFDPAARAAHERLAEAYAKRIAELKAKAGEDIE